MLKHGAREPLTSRALRLPSRRNHGTLGTVGVHDPKTNTTVGKPLYHGRVVDGLHRVQHNHDFIRKGAVRLGLRKRLAPSCELCLKSNDYGTITAKGRAECERARGRRLDSTSGDQILHHGLKPNLLVEQLSRQCLKMQTTPATKRAHQVRMPPRPPSETKDRLGRDPYNDDVGNHTPHRNLSPEENTLILAMRRRFA